MTSFRYLAPDTVAEAQTAIAEHGPDAKPLAGGTDLLVLIRAGRIRPRMIVDLKRLPLRYVKAEQGQLRIGALATHADLASHPTVRAEFAALASAARVVGGPALRNRATVGGNVVNASPAADAVAPLFADDARAIVAGLGGEREVPFAALFTGYRDTALAADELLTEIRIPRVADASSSRFVKAGNRAAMIIATVNIACRLTVGRDGRVTDARLCYGSVAPTALRIRDAERVLIGSSLDELDAEIAAQLAAETVAPISDTRASATHRVRLVRVHTRRALESIRDELKEAVHRV
jgi:CO/xanthine dehydrogenase FAD-binding subunit